MKRFKNIINLLCWFILLTGFSPIKSQKALNLLDQFNQLQDEITATLLIEEEKYIYDINRVEEIIFNSDINFAELSKELGFKITKESFYELSIENIKNAKLSNNYQERSFNVCGVTRNEEGWNYGRNYYSYYGSKDVITNLLSNANAIAGGYLDWKMSVMAISSVLPPFAALTFAGTTISFTVTSYMRGLAKAMEYNNSFNTCGTVTDINKFTRVYTVWPQK